MGIVGLGLIAEKLRGMSALLQAASSCGDKLSSQQSMFGYLSSELAGMADELEYGDVSEYRGSCDAIRGGRSSEG